MLQNLREHVQGWIASLIAGILCIAFALWGIQYYLESSRGSTDVAKVNGAAISQQQFDTVYKLLRQRLKLESESAVLDPAQQARLKAAALEELINQYVLGDAATKQGFRISNEQINAIIAAVPAFQVNGQFSPALFQRYTEDLYPSQDAFITDLKQKAAIIQARSGIMTTAFALPFEVDQAVMLANQQRDLSWFIIPAAQFLPKVKVTDDEIQAYYKAHQQDFMTEEQLSIQYIELSSDQMIKKTPVTDAEIQQYYQDNQSAFTSNGKLLPLAEVHDKIADILKQQKTEQTLADQSDQLANLTYTNPDTLKVAADNLGLAIQTSGLFNRQGSASGLTSNPKIVHAAFSNNVLQLHNNSDVIPLDSRTLVVLRVAEHKPSTVRPLAEVRPLIEQQLQAQAAQKQAKQWGDSIIKQLQQGASKEQIAAQQHINWIDKTAVGRKTADIPSEILQFGFSLAPVAANKPAIGGRSLAAGDYAVLMVNHIQSGATQNDPKERTAVQQRIAAEQGDFDYYLYTTQQMQAAKIKREENINSKEQE